MSSLVAGENGVIGELGEPLPADERSGDFMLELPESKLALDSDVWMEGFSGEAAAVDLLRVKMPIVSVGGVGEVDVR